MANDNSRKFKQNQKIICIPVSYTHLDVYKRQEHMMFFPIGLKDMPKDLQLYTAWKQGLLPHRTCTLHNVDSQCWLANQLANCDIL